MCIYICVYIYIYIHRVSESSCKRVGSDSQCTVLVVTRSVEGDSDWNVTEVT